MQKKLADQTETLRKEQERLQKRKMLKCKIFTIFLMILLVLPAMCEEPAASEYFKNSKSFTELQQEAGEASPLQQNKNIYKQPISKRKIAKKFLTAMGGVAVSSVLLFIILTAYNKIREKFAAKPVCNTDEKSLATPDNLHDAIKIFLDKTDWNK